jgi:hypothetical protein
MNSWTKLGKSPGPVMWSYGFMRVERTNSGWRAWDVLRVPQIRPMFPTTIHKTLRDAKKHCEQVCAGT